MNIWASFVYAGDTYFHGPPDGTKTTLSAATCERLHQTGASHQIWMANAVLRDAPTSQGIVQTIYPDVRDANESYLLVLAPGYGDLINDVPSAVYEIALGQAASMARAFNKRVLGFKLGIPPDIPPAKVERLSAVNSATEAIIGQADGAVVDMSGLEYEPWSEHGSRPIDVDAAAETLADAILRLHSGMDVWRSMHGKS